MDLFWKPAQELSLEEQRILKSCKKSKLFTFLRNHRLELFDDAFQKELSAVYPQRDSGKPVVPPALLATALLLQAWFGFSDQDAAESAQWDSRWKMILGTLEESEAPFCQATLCNFRQRLIENQLDRRLFEKTVQLARSKKGFSHTALRVAFDSSPLYGAGRVEDTWNLIAHAVRNLLLSVAVFLGIDYNQTADRAGIPLAKGRSLKAHLNIDWNNPQQKQQALQQLLKQVEECRDFIQAELSEEIQTPPMKEQWETLNQILAQDIEPEPTGGKRLRRKSIPDRRISIEDKDMRHGHKTKLKLFAGFKNHLAQDIETGIVVAVDVTKGNQTDDKALLVMEQEIARQRLAVAEGYTDRAYLETEDLYQAEELKFPIHCKAYSIKSRGKYTKEDFKFDWKQKKIKCPAGQEVSFQEGEVAKFPRETCQICPKRESCTSSKQGRSVSIHIRENFLQKLRTRQQEPEEKANLQMRTYIEHGLGKVVMWQGHKARYRGIRKNRFDLYRHASLVNLHVAAA